MLHQQIYKLPHPLQPSYDPYTQRPSFPAETIIIITPLTHFMVRGVMKSQPRCQVSVLGLQETIIFIINKSLLFFHELNYCFGLGFFFKMSEYWKNPTTISISPKWHLQMAFFQKPKIFHLEWYKTERAYHFCLTSTMNSLLWIYFM